MTARRKSSRRKATGRKQTSRKKTARKPAPRRSSSRKKAVRKKAVRKQQTARKQKASRKKAARKPAPGRKAAAQPTAAPQAPAAPLGAPGSVAAATAQRVGRVTHYFPHAHAGAIQVEDASIHVGDTMHFRGHTTDFYQRIERIELDHRPVEAAHPGQEVGLQLSQRVREHDEVFRVS